MNTRVVRALAAVLVASLVVAGCGGSSSKKSSSTQTRPVSKGRAYVGKVSGTDAYIALVTDGKVVQGYVCDGHVVAVWLKSSPLRHGEVHLTSRKGKPLGSATIVGDQVTGTVKAATKAQAFSATLTAGKEGLYRAAKGKPGEPKSVEVGWIVLPDLSQRGATNVAGQNGSTAISQAPVLRPGATSVDVPKAGTLMVDKFTNPLPTL